MLGIVSDEYEIVDNKAAFAFLDALIGGAALRDGRQPVGRSARLGARAATRVRRARGGDPSATYVYVANSHDGSLGVTAAATPIRIVCANTLNPYIRIQGAYLDFDVIRTRVRSRRKERCCWR
ncbi:MAG: DUF932 domain-containing protein [Solirubrobacterales bacterium]|nr:DUF932 domain-containing protein [Solirubrobacterales bacterium]